ncbi:TPA: CtsR family transcriptional regulator, partial [Streptococcus pyogenes]
TDGSTIRARMLYRLLQRIDRKGSN